MALGWLHIWGYNPNTQACGKAQHLVTSRAEAASTKTRVRPHFHGNCWQPRPKCYRANDMTEMCASGVKNTNNRRTSSIPAPEPPSRSVCRVHKAISAALISRQMTYLLLITFSRLAAAPRWSTDSRRKSTRIPIRREIGSNTPPKLVLHTLLPDCSESVYSSFSACKWQTAEGGKRTHKYFSTWEARWEEMRWEPVAKD